MPDWNTVFSKHDRIVKTFERKLWKNESINLGYIMPTINRRNWVIVFLQSDNFQNETAEPLS